MNTFKKGDDLETFVLEILKRRVECHIDGSYVSLHKHKKYKSKLNDRFVVVDVSIDCYLSEEDKNNDIPYRSVFFECKNHKHTLNIAQYDAFQTKLKYFPSNKGCLVAVNGFSKETIRLAEKDGIALIQVAFDRTEMDYIVRRSINSCSIRTELLDVLKGGKSNQQFLLYYDSRFISIDDFLQFIEIPIVNQIIEIPFLSSAQIEDCVKKAYPRIFSSYDILADIMVSNQEFTLYNDKLDESVLGYFDVRKCEIHLNDKLMSKMPRYRFTLAHEIGHYFLHYSLLKENIHILGDTNNSIYDMIEHRHIKRIEYQANLFASYLLMPQIQFLEEVSKSFELYSINRGRLFVDDQSCNLQNYHNVVGRISKKFNVSKKSVEIRLKEQDLMIDKRSEPQRINIRVL